MVLNSYELEKLMQYRAEDLLRYAKRERQLKSIKKRKSQEKLVAAGL